MHPHPCCYPSFSFLASFDAFRGLTVPMFLLKQEDKEPVFDSVKTIIGMLEVSTEFAQNITFNQQTIERALPAGHLDATTLADYLVKKASNCASIS